jgi:Zn-dependent peptidase ImmA (M78 family)
MSNDYESVSDDLLTPNLKGARLRAKNIWNEFCGAKIPVKLNDIIQKMGIDIRGEDLNSADAITRMDSNGVCCMVYDQNSSVVRKRFTIAHEIGHLAMEHTSSWGGCNQFSKKSQEKEADAFAGELLVPSEDLKEFTKQKRTIQEIMSRYWISNPAAFVAVQNNRLLDRIKI